MKLRDCLAGAFTHGVGGWTLGRAHRQAFLPFQQRAIPGRRTTGDRRVDGYFRAGARMRTAHAISEWNIQNRLEGGPELLPEFAALCED